MRWIISGHTSISSLLQCHAFQYLFLIYIGIHWRGQAIWTFLLGKHGDLKYRQIRIVFLSVEAKINMNWLNIFRYGEAVVITVNGMRTTPEHKRIQIKERKVTAEPRSVFTLTIYTNQNTDRVCLKKSRSWKWFLLASISSGIYLFQESFFFLRRQELFV